MKTRHSHLNNSVRHLHNSKKYVKDNRHLITFVVPSQYPQILVITDYVIDCNGKEKSDKMEIIDEDMPVDETTKEDMQEPLSYISRQKLAKMHTLDVRMIAKERDQREREHQQMHENDKVSNAAKLKPTEGHGSTVVDLEYDDNTDWSLPSSNSSVGRKQRNGNLDEINVENLATNSVNKYNTFTFDWFKNLRQTDAADWLLCTQSYICYLASDCTWITLQLFEELSSAAGNHPVQYLGIIICIYVMAICLPAWFLAVGGLYTKTKHEPIIRKIYTGKNLFTIFVSFVAIAITLINNAPYWKLLIWLSSIPYFTLGAFISINIRLNDH